ncbi:hypothetical protein T03_5847 [Trichinella britovi]|uniref:Uncharacterized protein n=1 Tax=Trichinella britovi TaxID=45882 RepID=A0A0V1CA89_TRIBR|nr:hypothetical protein T03_5847 [Trichinella britovi]
MNRAVQQMDNDCTREKGFVKRNAAYRVQQRRVTALTVYFCPLYILHYSSDLCVVTSKCCACFWDNNLAILNSHAFCVNEKAEHVMNTGRRKTGQFKQTLHKVNPEKVLLPPLHIKLGIMKQFVKALDKNGTCFQYLCTQFPLLSDAKLKEGIFVGPDIQKLIKDKMFSSTVTQVEEEAWVAFTNVVSGFLGKKKDPEYGRLNLGDISEEQSERIEKKSLELISQKELLNLRTTELL